MPFVQKELGTSVHPWEALLGAPCSRAGYSSGKGGLSSPPHRRTGGEKQKLACQGHSEGGEGSAQDKHQAPASTCGRLLEVWTLSRPSWNWATSVSKPHTREGSSIARCLLMHGEDNRKVTRNLRIHDERLWTQQWEAVWPLDWQRLRRMWVPRVSSGSEDTGAHQLARGRTP